MKIEWHRLARLDLIEIVSYISNDNPDAALRMLDEIERQAELLRNMPEMGRPGRCHGTRDLVVAGTAYILPYRIDRDRIVILRVLHGAQRWPKRF